MYDFFAGVGAVMLGATGMALIIYSVYERRRNDPWR